MYCIGQLILYVDSLIERAPNQGLMMKVFLGELVWTFIALLAGASYSRKMSDSNRTECARGDEEK